MPSPAPTPDPSLLVRSTFDDTTVRRAHLRGDLVRLTAGRYLRRSDWDSFDPASRHAMTAIAAVSCLRSSPVVVSHASAAAFWGFPRLGPWPARTHVLDPALSTGKVGRYVQRHAGALPDGDVVERYGVLVTSPERTALDLAVSATFRQAVVSLDHAYRTGLASPDALQDRLARRTSTRGRAKAATAIEFASAKANRPGESLSRVVMHETGVAVPCLQRSFRGPLGQKADVDFYWDDVRVVGEFDGNTKYRDSERWSGLPPEEVVIREKDRENWLRAHPEVDGFVRWTWRDVVTPGALPSLLRQHGVPVRA
ncbi:hypothetical protein AX769_10510 [Frondihabitans sp. PAMC 28766]|uniref:hypothetical protein n=1 Tax=Frondihabitans sp. PAMC 28766 TaxID=1795630 RepID=UPI00078B831E|nr:hypothetical protein [Frondihabitans sp. PAMC 28766]AMM20500.1 hypothetical protein AX769_10510 [Frondihabitans sp. PAMC 28766]